jgi:FixJ family two-component response regulator
VKIIVGTSGQINELLKGVPNEEFISAAPFGDSKVLVVVKGEAVKAGEVVEIIKEVEIEVIKEVIKNNPENLATIEEQEGQIQTLQDALSDALNAEEAAKKIAEDLKISLKTLKTKFTKLKNKFLEED